MNSGNKMLLFILLPLALAYPLYAVVDVVVSGSIGEHCARPTAGRGGAGLFCTWGLDFGRLLFGPAQAHLGYALLLGATALGFAGFALWVVGGSADSGDKGAGGSRQTPTPPRE